jgi:uncharacterized protein YhfF
VLALILDRTHRVLVDTARDRPPDVPLASARPLLDVDAAFSAQGMKLPLPAGSRPAMFGRDFAFVTEKCDPPAGMRWSVLRALTHDDVVWRLYVDLMLGGYEPPTRAVDVWSFGNEPEMAARLAHLVANGAKRVTMGWVQALEKLGVPQPYTGGVSVVTDGFGFPRLLLRSTDVRVVRFDEVDSESAAGEGEGDLTYADWRDGHVAYFTAEAARTAMTFDGSARIAIERFELLRVL